MSSVTKKALEASLKKLLHEKRLDKITIQDLTTDCGISRSAFYYHFQDIYALVEWACMEDFGKALSKKTTSSTWEEGFLQILKEVYKDKEFIYNVYYFNNRELVIKFLYEKTFLLLYNVVEEQSKNLKVTDSQKRFVTDFYKYGFVGITLDWLEGGMKEKPESVAEKMGVILHGSFLNSLKNCDEFNKKY